jgi:dipeptidyl aminopeptidase/acylaminoacyl peptidase
MPRTAPFGAWTSPVTAALVAGKTVDLNGLTLLGPETYWCEGRPSEGGRQVLVRHDGRSATDLLPAPYNARTRVHEYGGRSFSIDAELLVTFSHFPDQRLYTFAAGTADSADEPRPLTAEGAGRFADLRPDPPRRRLLAVHESEADDPEQVHNSLVAVELDGGKVRTLVTGHDFFSSPCLSPDGRRLAWLSWDHPDMPWDATELWLAELDHDGTPHQERRVAGGSSESVFQPRFSPGGELTFVSDRTGWWNLYRWEEGAVRPLAPMEAEMGVPQWIFGMSTYAFASPEEIVCAVCRRGEWRLGIVEGDSGRFRDLELPYTHVEEVRAGDGRSVFLAASPTTPPAIVSLDLDSGRSEVLRSSSAATVDERVLSLPRSIELPTSGGATAYAFFYPPRNDDFEAPVDTRPPLLVKSHGGPTAASSNAFSPGIQYWTSRGFAVVDVNYRGSTGYGRAYRDARRGRWGELDVDDCVAAAQHLAETGEVDGERLAIRGGSAGGFTTLAALTFRDVFRAGASHYGIGDLEALARDTHKFESRYLDRLVGPYPEERALYLERSPLRAAERLSCPLIFFQGLEDRVVLPSQAEEMVAALREKGVPVAYVTFAGEQHGFRQAASIIRALEAELYFYSRVFGFTAADELEPVEIANPDALP